MKSFLAALLWPILLAECGFAQTTADATQVFRQAVARTHGTSTPAAFEAHGTITYLWPNGEVSGPVTLSVSDENEILFRSTVGGHDKTLEVRGTAATLVEDGKSSSMPLATAERVRFIAAPYLLPLFAKNHSWQSYGRVPLGARTAQAIHNWHCRFIVD